MWGGRFPGKCCRGGSNAKEMKGYCDLQTQLSGLLRLVTTRTFPAALAIGIAQHTTRGTERPLLAMMIFKCEDLVFVL